MTCEKDWIDIFTAFLIPLIAFFGSIIAFQQWKFNHYGLKVHRMHCD